MSQNAGKFFESNRDLILLVSLFVLVLLIYWQVTGFQFVNLDDNKYVYENGAVLGGLTGANVSWAFSTFFFSNWHPLTWLSHQLDISLFGLSPGAHHATSAFVHLINTVLAFEFFRRLTGSFWKSATVAALFAVHPLHVESVAWVSERKDVLSMMFWLLASLAYTGFARSRIESNTEKKPTSKAKTGFAAPLIEGFKSRHYLLALLMFALGLMAKPMLVTLPFVFLLLDFWPLDRFRRWKDLKPLAVEKLPFFVLTIVSAFLTVEAQSVGGALRSFETVPFWSRLANAAVAYVTYIVQLFYPFNLSVFYPYETAIPFWKISGSVVLLGVITGFCVWQLEKRKYLLAGWLWFAGTLVPVIGILQVGGQSHADRYTYIPYFGLFIMIVWGGRELSAKLGLNRIVAGALAVIAILFLSYLSFEQVGYWKDSETLFKHSISVTRRNYLLTQNYCHELTLQNRLGEAEKQCRDSIEYKPDQYLAYASLGNVQIKQKQFKLAEASFTRALELGPAAHQYFFNLATAQSLQGKPLEAEKSLRQVANRMPPKAYPQIWTLALSDLATAFEKESEYEKAAENYSRALSIAPLRTDLRAKLATSLFMAKKFEDAETQIKIVLGQAADKPEPYDLYGSILMKLNKRDEAIAAYEKAISIKPDFEIAKKNLEKAKRSP